MSLRFPREGARTRTGWFSWWGAYGWFHRNGSMALVWAFLGPMTVLFIAYIASVARKPRV